MVQRILRRDGHREARQRGRSGFGCNIHPLNWQLVLGSLYNTRIEKSEAGTHLGVYRSPDRGASWVRFGGGMPLVEVSDIYLSDDSTLMRAATDGRGFWELQR